MKNGNFDLAVCPSCATVITRQQMYGFFVHRMIFICDCGYEFTAPPYRPLTIAEMLQGRKVEVEYRKVDLESYTRSIFEIMKGTD